MRRVSILICSLLLVLAPIVAGAQTTNRLSLRGAPSGGTPELAATGVDTNISINLVPKGTGTINVPGIALTLPIVLTGVVTGDLLVGTAANTLNRLADTAVGQVLAAGGVGVAPLWSATPTVTGLTLSGNTAGAFLYSDATKGLVSTSAPTSGQLLIGSTGAVPVLGAVAGTTGQIAVTLGAGTITLTIAPTAVGSATGKNMLCIDNTTNILYLSSSTTTCAN
jgi:hypothetical protein